MIKDLNINYRLFDIINICLRYDLGGQSYWMLTAAGGLRKSGHIEVLYSEDLRRNVTETAMKIWQRNSTPSVSFEFSLEAR